MILSTIQSILYSIMQVQTSNMQCDFWKAYFVLDWPLWKTSNVFLKHIPSRSFCFSMDSQQDFSCARLDALAKYTAVSSKSSEKTSSAIKVLWRGQSLPFSLGFPPLPLSRPIFSLPVLERITYPFLLGFAPFARLPKHINNFFFRKDHCFCLTGIRACLF